MLSEASVYLRIRFGKGSREFVES